jgi:cytochrome c oxidase subunit 3
VPPPKSGGGDGGRGDNGAPDYGGRLRRARLGLITALVAIVMIFVALTSAYVIRQGLPVLDPRTGKPSSDWLQVNLPTQLLLINTFLLLLSSMTAEFARRQMARLSRLAPVQGIPGVSLGEEKNFPWLAVSVVLGIGFLFGQWLAWRELADRGFHLSEPISSSFVYLLTAAHAVHLIGGVLAFIYCALISLAHVPLERRRIAVDISVWYWHFMAFLWVYIFALLEFAR